MTELTRMTAAEIAQLVAAGECSAVEVTQAHLDRIAAVDDRVHAFLHVDAEGALAAARAVDERRAAGEELGPLAGVPVAVKDVLDHQGRADHRAARRSSRAGARRTTRRSCSRLREAGTGDARQDQHGRVRDGLVHRVLGVRPDPQPVGPGPDPGRLRRRLAPRRWPRTRRRWRSAPTPAARSASPARSPAPSARSRPTAAPPGTAWSRSRPRWTLPARAPVPSLDAALLHEVIAGHDPRDSTSIPAAGAGRGRRPRGSARPVT